MVCHIAGVKSRDICQLVWATGWDTTKEERTEQACGPVTVVSGRSTGDGGGKRTAECDGRSS